MKFWSILVLLLLGGGIGFVLSAKLTSRYYIGVGMAMVLFAFERAAGRIGMTDQLSRLNVEASQLLHTDQPFNEILASARRTVKSAMFR